MAAPPPLPKQVIQAPVDLQPIGPKCLRLRRRCRSPRNFLAMPRSRTPGKRVAFFTSGDDVLVVAEGDKFLNAFRLLHIGNESADVEEIATGRRASVALVQPPDVGGNQ